jgi:hypothetical protein
LTGIYSPPQTPDSKIEKANPFEIVRPETPVSTHRLENPVFPETPTHLPLHSDSSLVGETSLFDDNIQIVQPTTPVLYNLIRNEGPPKFVIASKTPEKPRDEELDSPSEGINVFNSLMWQLKEKVLSVIRFGDILVPVFSLPGNFIFNESEESLNSTKSEDHLRKSVTDLFSQVLDSFNLSF